MYGPPVVGPNRLLRLLKSSARTIAPIDEAIHPSRLIGPNLANVAGSMKIPEAIIFPTTRAIVVHNPIF
jgi:hypothetical protein